MNNEGENGGEGGDDGGDAGVGILDVTGLLQLFLLIFPEFYKRANIPYLMNRYIDCIHTRYSECYCISHTSI